MLIYHLTDSHGWYDHYIYKTKRDAIKQAEQFMNRPEWEQTESITIHCIDTKTQRVVDVAQTFNGPGGLDTIYF